MTHSPSSAQSDLKPCPFCGCATSPELKGNGVGDNWLECVECGASTRLREDGAGSAKDWNRRAALTAEKVAGQEPVAIVRDNPDDIGTIIEATRPLEVGTQLYLAAPQQPAQPVAQTLALTGEQREAIEYAVRWMDENVSNRYAHTAAKELRALLAAQPASSLAEGGE